MEGDATQQVDLCQTRHPRRHLYTLMPSVHLVRLPCRGPMALPCSEQVALSLGGGTLLTPSLPLGLLVLCKLHVCNHMC